MNKRYGGDDDDLRLLMSAVEWAFEAMTIDGTVVSEKDDWSRIFS
jgi:hypothetical protein